MHLLCINAFMNPQFNIKQYNNDQVFIHSFIIKFWGIAKNKNLSIHPSLNKIIYYKISNHLINIKDVH